MTERSHVVIIGAGVIGLSTAVALLDHTEARYKVTIIAPDLPPLHPEAFSPRSKDAPPASYASAWAGAHHVSEAKNDRQLKRDIETYRIFKKIAGNEQGKGDACKAVVEVTQHEYWEDRDRYNGWALEQGHYDRVNISALLP